MSRTRVHNFSISLDGFATGEGLSLEAPFGHAGQRLHEWMVATRFGRPIIGQAGGSDGVDNAYAERHTPGIGAEIMGAGADCARSRGPAVGRPGGAGAGVRRGGGHCSEWGHAPDLQPLSTAVDWPSEMPAVRETVLGWSSQNDHQRYDDGMTAKIAVSLDDELVQQAREAVRAGRAASVSAYVASAMRQFARVEALSDVVDEIYRESGRPSQQDRAWVTRVLDEVEASSS